MLSVVIVNWNTRELLLSCLRSIESHRPSFSLQVVVVDNDSKDGSAEAVAANFSWVELIASKANNGYAKGNNIGFASAIGEYILTLNPDTELIDDSLERAVKLLESMPGVGCLGARQLGIDGGTQRSIRGFPTFLGIVGDITGLGRLLPGSRLDSYRMTAFDYDRQGPAPQPMGTFLLFKRESLKAIGDDKQPFDEQFPIFFNEVDLLYRLKQAGWNCVYSPETKILHHGGESTKQVRGSMIWESHKSLVKFLRKHYGSFWNAPGLAILTGLIYVAAFVRARGYHAGFKA